MAEFSYNSDLNGGSLMVRESRLIADLLLKRVSDDEWEQEIQGNNLLQKRSPATAKRNSRAIRSRLELLEPEFWRALRYGDDELATQVAFVCGVSQSEN
ncbi:MAG: BrxA family protein [Motiliproteus sp.]